MGNNLITDGGDVDVYFTKYKSYVAIMDQTGANAPTAQVLNKDDANYLGDIVWTYRDVGQYVGTLDGAFTKNTVILFQLNNNAFSYATRAGDADFENTVELNTFAVDYTGLDSKFYKSCLRIDVYPNTVAL